MTCEASVPWDKNNGIPSSVPVMTLTITDIHHASFKHWWMASFSTDGTRTNPFSTPKEQVCLTQRRKHPLSLPQSPPQYNLLGAATGIISRTLSTQHFVVDIAFLHSFVALQTPCSRLSMASSQGCPLGRSHHPPLWRAISWHGGLHHTHYRSSRHHHHQ